MKIDPLRLPQAGQRNQNRSPPKLHFVVVSKTVRLTLGELAFSWSRYEIVISLPVSWMVTELTSFPLQSQVQIALAPCWAKRRLKAARNSHAPSSSTVVNHAKPRLRPLFWPPMNP
jgi:hypothetical protein